MPIETFIISALCCVGRCLIKPSGRPDSNPQVVARVQWHQRDILGLCDHLCVCWCSFCCPCCMVGKIGQNVQEHGSCCKCCCACCTFCCLCSILPPLGSLQLWHYRKELMRKHNLTETSPPSLFVDLLCPCCSIAQLYTEARYQRARPAPSQMQHENTTSTVSPHIAMSSTMVPPQAPQIMTPLNNTANTVNIANGVASVVHHAVSIADSMGAF